MNAMLEQINSTGKIFVEFALPMLVQSSVLILILLLTDFALRKKMRAVFRYGIWLLVLIKLVLPTSLSAPLSLGYFLGDGLAYVDISRTTTEAETMEPTQAIVSPIIYPPRIEAGRDTSAVAPIIPEIEPAVTEPINSPVVSVTPVTWQGAVFLAWLSVVMAMGLLLLQRAFFVRGLVAQAKDANGLMAETLESCRGSMGVKRKIGLKVSANATSPAVCGLFRPVILVPQNLTSSLSKSQLRAVLLHELAHIKRGDLWVNLTQTVLQIIYFYNTLLWVANCVIRRVREQAVDEMVLVAMGEAARQYPQTLVNVAKMAFKRPALSLRLIGVVESKSALAGRIKHILNRPMPKKAKLGILGLAVVIITAAILLPMASCTPGPPSLVIKGTVKDAQTGEPIAGARVFDDGYGPKPDWEQIKADVRSEWGAITNSAGEYSFLTWPEHHSIKIEAPGYKAKRRSLYSGHFVFNKKDEEIFDFTLEPEKAEISFPIRKVSSVKNDKGGTFEWETSIDPRVRLYHGRYMVEDGVVKGHKGNVSLIPQKGRVNLKLDVELKDNMLNIQMQCEKNLVDGSSGTATMAGFTVVPPGAYLKHGNSIDSAFLTNKHLTLWQGDFIRDGKVVKSVIYAAYLRTPDDQETGFKPPVLQKPEFATAKEKTDVQVESEINWIVEDYGQTRLLSRKEIIETDNWVSIVASVVKNNGRYLVPDSGLTLKGLIKAAGYNKDKLAESHVELIRRSRQGNITALSIYSRNLKTLLSGEESDIVIKPNDAVVGGYIEPSSNAGEFWGQYSFSDVVELTVNDDGAKINMFADLDTGKLVTPPDTLDNNDENAVFRWIKDNGIDVMGETADSVRGLVGFNMFAARVDNYFWDADPVDFTDRLLIKINEPVLLSVENLLPVTYLIQTTEHKMGILQILGFAEKPKGIKIRYKLLNKEDADKTDVQVEGKERGKKNESKWISHSAETNKSLGAERQIVIEARVFSIKTPNTSIPDYLYSKLGIKNVNTETPLMMPVQLTNEQADEFEKWAAAIPGTTTLVSPRVTAANGELVDLSLTTQHELIMSYKKPEDSSGKPEPVFEKFTTGVKLGITPELQRDGKAIVLKLAFSKNDLVRVKKGLNESGYEIELPVLNTVSINTNVLVASGKNTLVPVAGLFSGKIEAGGKPIQQTLLLVKTTILNLASGLQEKPDVQVED